MEKSDSGTQRFLFGQLVVRLGLATSDDVSAALAAQPLSGMRIGELLMARGRLTGRQVRLSLGLQRLLRALSLAAVVATPVALAAPGDANTGQNTNVAPQARTQLVISADRPPIDDRQPIAIPVKSLVQMLANGVQALKPNQQRLQYEVDAYDSGGVGFQIRYQF